MGRGVGWGGVEVGWSGVGWAPQVGALNSQALVLGESLPRADGPSRGPPSPPGAGA